MFSQFVVAPLLVKSVAAKAAHTCSRKGARRATVRSGVAEPYRSPRRPNPSVNRSANGMPPGPIHRYGVHCLWLGPGVMPLSPGYLKR